MSFPFINRVVGYLCFGVGIGTFAKVNTMEHIIVAAFLIFIGALAIGVAGENDRR